MPTATEPKRKPGRPGHPSGELRNKPIRITLNQASVELSIDRTALHKKLVAISEYPGPDGKYSLTQVCAAKYGHYELERTRKMREDADRVSAENAQARGQLVDIDMVIAYCQGIGLSLRQVITSSLHLDPDTKRDALLEIEDLFNRDAIKAATRGE